VICKTESRLQAVRAAAAGHGVFILGIPKQHSWRLWCIRLLPAALHVEARFLWSREHIRIPMAHLCPRSSNRLLYKRAGFNNARAFKRAYNRAAAQSGVILLVIPLFLLLTTEAQNAHNGGTDLVVGAQLTLDSGFAGDQRANVSNVTVNDNTWSRRRPRRRLRPLSTARM
jgi:hypothetical protein